MKCFGGIGPRMYSLKSRNCPLLRDLPNAGSTPLVWKERGSKAIGML